MLAVSSFFQKNHQQTHPNCRMLEVMHQIPLSTCSIKLELWHLKQVLKFIYQNSSTFFVVVNSSKMKSSSAVFTSLLNVDYVAMFSHQLQCFCFVQLRSEMNGRKILFIQNICCNGSERGKSTMWKIKSLNLCFDCGHKKKTYICKRNSSASNESCSTAV